MIGKSNVGFRVEVLTTARRLLMKAGALLLLCAGAPALAIQGPVELLRETNQILFDEVEQRRGAIEQDPGVAHDLVRNVLTPHMDLERISRWVLGKFWRKASDVQQARFIDEFRTLLIRTYASAITEFSHLELTYLPLEAEEGATDVRVRTEVTTDSETISIVYRMHLNHDGWKVYDVTVGGVSLVTTYRATFSRLVRNDGMDGLIERLAEKNRETTS